MKTNINIKILPVVIVGVAVLAAIFFGFSHHNEQLSLDEAALGAVASAKKTYDNLIDNDINNLKLAITTFSADEEFKNIFLQDDRAQLFDYGENLFAQCKDFGVSQFNFIREDGTILTRLQNAEIYNDQAYGDVFQKSQRIEGWGAGIELGQTEFSLKVAYPYFNYEDVLGYIELAQEINHHLETLKQQTGHEYTIIVKKKLIDAKAWAFKKTEEGRRNNYDDATNYLIVESTMGDDYKLLAASVHIQDEHGDDNLLDIPDEGKVFHQFEMDGKNYVSGGFPFVDASGEEMGVIALTQDISAIVARADKNDLEALLLAILGTIAISLIMIVLIRGIVVKPLNKVVEAATRVVGGDFKATADVHSKDEVGELAGMLNSLSQVMGNTGVELDDTYRKLDIAEKLRKSSEEKLNLVKQRIQERVTQDNK